MQIWLYIFSYKVIKSPSLMYFNIYILLFHPSIPSSYLGVQQDPFLFSFFRIWPTSILIQRYIQKQTVI